MDNGFVETSTNDWTLLISSGSIKEDVYKNLRKYQKVNHFPRSTELTRKDLLYKNVAKFQANNNNLKSLNFIPHSYVLPQDFSYLEEAMDKNRDFIWIVKPVASSQGKGIFLTNKTHEVIIIYY